MTAASPDLLSLTSAQPVDQRTAALRAAMSRHACVACGEFGPFRLGGNWWCGAHSWEDAQGWWEPTAEGLTLAAERRVA